MRTVLGCLLLAACGTDIRTGEPELVLATWHQDVAPIVATHCMGCHQDCGIGPFDLTTYDAATENAGNMLDKIFGVAVNAPPQPIARTMPLPEELPLHLMDALNVD